MKSCAPTTPMSVGRTIKICPRPTVINSFRGLMRWLAAYTFLGNEPKSGKRCSANPITVDRNIIENLFVSSDPYLPSHDKREVA